MSQALPPGEFAKALQDKRVARRRKRLLFWGIGSAVLLILILLVSLAYFSPILATRQVEVAGTSLLKPDRVREVAEVEEGLPVVRQDLAAIQERVLELPQVREVKAVVELPDTIKITVTERTLVYQRVAAGKSQWIDAEGVVFHTTKDATKGVVQVITSDEDVRLLRDVADVVLQIPEKLRPEVTKLTAEAVDRITLTLTGGRSVVWGSAEESELKGEVLTALLSVDAKVYDVSAPRNPTTSES